jgi:hypothetical protein
VIDYIHRKTDDADIYYVSSRWQPVEKVECTFRVSGKQPEIWNPVTGEIRELTDFKQENGRTIIPLEFNPCGSHFIVLRNSINISEKKPNWPSYKTVHEISGSWQVQFDENWGGPASTKFDQLIDWTLNSNKGIKYYSGKATYSKTFDLTDSVMKDKSEFYLDLGQVHELAEVRLNGVDLGVLWTKPFRVNITSAIKTKGNKLEIDVVNLWPNRLIGDEFLPENERYTKTNIRKFTKSSQLFPSGLIGPVEIKMYKKIGSQ